MRIGILTFHRAHNYGAVLQCYALQEIIQEMGVEVDVIDYKQPFLEAVYTPHFRIKEFIHRIVKKDFRGGIIYIYGYFLAFKKRRVFEKFRQKHLNIGSLTNNETIPQCYGKYVIGSDQVWGIHCTNGYDPIFWGNFPTSKDSQIFGYAISSNGDYKDCLSNEMIINNVSNFTKIGFREKQTLLDIQNITGKKFDICVDPTLLTDSSLWENLVNETKWKNKKYVVLYQVRYSKVNPNFIKRKTYEYAKKNGCEVINASRMTYSVEDFVSMIKYAECVFTSSFHATVFSVLWGTPFFTFKLYDGHDGRYTAMLEQLNLSNHLVDATSDTSVKIEVDKNRIKRDLINYRHTSEMFLKNILS